MDETGSHRSLAMQLHRPGNGAGEAVVNEEVQALVAACWKEKRCEELWQLAEEFEDVLQIWIFNSLRVLKNGLRKVCSCSFLLFEGVSLGQFLDWHFCVSSGFIP